MKIILPSLLVPLTDLMQTNYLMFYFFEIEHKFNET
jgi:hypothetical protein